MERCSRVLLPTCEGRAEQRGHWRDLMPQARELHLELGCGKGRFTVETAAQNPDVLFIAIERVPDDGDCHGAGVGTGFNECVFYG